MSGAASVDNGDSAARRSSRSRSPRRQGESQGPSGSESVRELVAQAQECLDQMPPDVDRARELFEQALQADGEDAQVLDNFGAFLCEEGDSERAEELLKKSIELRPSLGADKFLVLAQIKTGEEALAYYVCGTGILRKEAGAVEGAEAVAIKQKIAVAEAAVAEIYMSDLCDLEDAEDKCEAALQRGAEASPDCLELLATTASLRKVQGKIDEARELAVRCAKRVAAGMKADDILIFPDGEQKEDNTDGDAAASASTQAVGSDTLADEDVVQLCRTLLDLGEASEARQLLEPLLEKDEEDIQVWVLLGFSHVLEKDAEAARECAGQGAQLCKRMGREAGQWRPHLRDLLQRIKRLESSGASASDAAVV